MTDRKLARIVRLGDVHPHPNADLLELAQVGGWQCVVKKGEFKKGQLVLYFEIDSWVPHSLAPFLTKGSSPREFNGVPGERLRTVRLRGQLSQGLVLPLDVLPDNTDLTEQLGVQKWDNPLPAQLSGQVKGNFPNFIRKTDQERIQNLWPLDLLEDEVFEVTFKLDGSSMTIYRTEAGYGVCSRNLDLKLEDKSNNFIQMFDKLIAEGFELPVGYAVQGELIGEGIQGNFEGITGRQYFVYNVWNIATQEYFKPIQARIFCIEANVNYVPVMHFHKGLKHYVLADLLEMADGDSAFDGKYREGLVFKSNQRDFSFKVISNRYLEKGGD